MQDGVQAFSRHSSLLQEASLSWGVPRWGASDAVGHSQGQEGSSKVSDFPPPVSFQIARKKTSVMCIIITKCCIKKYPSAMPARRKSYLPNVNAKVEIFKGF